MTNALIAAIKSGRELSAQEVADFVAGGINPNEADEHGEPPLISAVKNRSYKNVEALLNYRKTDINITNQSGNTAMIWAAAMNDLKMVNLLLDCGASVGVKNRSNQTAEIVAGLQGAVEIAGKLNYRMATLNKKLRKIFEKEDPDSKYFAQLVNLGANPNMVEETGISVLILAASLNKKELVNALLKNGVDVNYSAAINGENYTAARIAYEQGYQSLFNKIIYYSLASEDRQKYRDSLDDIVANQFDLSVMHEQNLLFLAEGMTDEKYGDKKISDLIEQELQRRNLSAENQQVVVAALKKANDLYSVANEVQEQPSSKISQAFDASHQGFKSIAVLSK